MREKILRYIQFHCEAYGAPPDQEDFVEVLHLSEEDVDAAVQGLLAENRIRFWSGRYVSGYILV